MLGRAGGARALEPARGGQAGFTLIEVSLVVAILGILLLLGAMRMDTLTPERSLVSAARRLRATLEEMHNAVLLRGQAGTLVYDLTKETYRLEFQPPPPEEGVTGPQPSEILLEGTLPEGVAFQKVLRKDVPDQAEGELRLRLTAGGACPPHAVQLGLADGGPAVQTLRVDPLLGSVQIFPEAKAFDALFSTLPDDRP